MNHPCNGVEAFPRAKFRTYNPYQEVGGIGHQGGIICVLGDMTMLTKGVKRGNIGEPYSESGLI